MSAGPKKILALQFKYFGDAVLMSPALRALRQHYATAELHLLVPAEMAPLFQHLPWLNRVWAMPRRRGSARLRETWPLLAALRRERFDRSVDFATNDRGAILGRIIGAPERLGWDEPGGFFGRKHLYTTRIAPPQPAPHESVRLAHLLDGWQIPPPDSFAAEIRADDALAGEAEKILPANDAVIFHVASSQQKKEWPLAHWVALHRLAEGEGLKVVFTTARGEREAALMTELKRLAPTVEILPGIPDLPLLFAVLARAKLFVSGDTGPLHFAAGLGVRTVSLFGPTAPDRWAPIGQTHHSLTGGTCTCDGNLAACVAANHCLAAITPEQVLAKIKSALIA